LVDLALAETVSLAEGTEVALVAGTSVTAQPSYNGLTGTMTSESGTFTGVSGTFVAGQTGKIAYVLFANVTVDTTTTLQLKVGTANITQAHPVLSFGAFLSHGWEHAPPHSGVAGEGIAGALGDAGASAYGEFVVLWVDA